MGRTRGGTLNGSGKEVRVRRKSEGVKRYLCGFAGNIFLWLHSNHVKVMKTEPCATCQKGGGAAANSNFQALKKLNIICATYTHTHTHPRACKHQPTPTHTPHTAFMGRKMQLRKEKQHEGMGR